MSVHKGFKRQFKMEDGLRLIPNSEELGHQGG